MSDYSALLKAELLDLVIEKDTEITAKENEISKLKEELLEEQNNITDDEIENETANSIIARILALPEEEKKALPELVRTTEKGIKAYTTFLYGVATGIEDEEEETDENEENNIL